MRKLDLLRTPILPLQHHRQIPPRRKTLQALNRHLIARPHLLIIVRVRKREREHALFLQVRLVDTRERADDDGETAEEARFECGVLTGGTFTVVVVTDDDPFDALVTVLRGDLRDTSVFAGELVLDLVRLAVLLVDSTDETVF